MPEFNAHFEMIFVEGHSQDDTVQAIQAAIAHHPELNCRLIHQSRTGKGNAVREAFAIAQGEILAILDADLTVPCEYLPRFYEAIRQGTGEFINGVRLVYPREREAMRFFNLVGNKLFGLVISWILDQQVKDTLCGTKVLRRRDYEKIARGREYFGDFDPFGDFDLLFGAARLNLKIVDLPVRYRGRAYGQTNIQRWKHGWLLFKMAAFALFKLKFQ
jgi:glycosyltransferase involved in cell wall biosynthesis